MRLFKKAKLEGGALAIVWVVGILAAVYMFAQYYTPATVTPPAEEGKETTPGDIPCPYAPTVLLTAQDKYDSSVDVDTGTWKYILNSGGSTTDADGSFEVGKTDKLEVLVADANSSTHYRALWKIEGFECKKNSLLYPNVVKYTTYETKCYNEDGDTMNGTTYSYNLSIASEGARDVKCEITGVTDTGMPYGGMMILEFNQSTYKREDLNKLTLGGAWGSSTVTPESSTSNAYTVGAAGATTKSFKVPKIESTGTYKFDINTLQAKANVDPTAHTTCTDSNYGNGVYGRVYPINCYEEEDVTPTVFKCGLADMDDTFTSPGGTAKGSAAVATFCIPVR